MGTRGHEEMKFYKVWYQVNTSRGDRGKGVFNMYYEVKGIEQLHEVLKGGGKCPNRTDASVFEIKPVSQDEYELDKVLDFKRRHIRENC